MDPKELYRKAKEELDKMKALHDIAKKESRVLTEEEMNQAEQHMQTSKDFEKQAQDIEKQEQMFTEANSRYDSLSSKAQPNQPSQVPPSASTRIEVGEPNWKDDPKKGFKSHSEMLLEVLEVQRKGKRPSANLEYLAMQPKATAGSDEQSTFSKPYGGFAVPEAWAPDMLKIQAEADKLAGYTTKVPMETPIVNLLARTDKDHSSSVSGGFQVYRRAEADTVSSSRGQMEEVKLEANSLFGVAHATRELLERSAISFVSLIEQGFRSEFANKLMKERIAGTGVGQMEGILNLGSGILISVSKETDQAANTFTFQNSLDMMSRCWGFEEDGVWLMNKTVLPQLPQLNLVHGTAGIAVFIGATGAQDAIPMTLWGRPIIFSEHCKALGTKGDVICANWSQYLEGLYRDVRTESSIFVRWEEHEESFKFWLENDGRCWWRSYLTPANGSTLSPFVVLNNR